MTRFACIEKARQLFPKLVSLDGALSTADGGAWENATDAESEIGEFRMVSTGKFIWNWALPSPATGKLTCTGDFNTRRIETLNYNGLDKRPALNEVWKISSLRILSSKAEAVSVQNMETSK